MLERALGWIGLRSGHELRTRPDYHRHMREALARIEAAESLMREASSLEQLDLARSILQHAQVEVQQVIRSAKRDRGITVRPVSESEELHRKMRDYMKGRSRERPGRHRDGTGAAQAE